MRPLRKTTKKKPHLRQQVRFQQKNKYLNCY
nr:MAG TPA: hypothetical protein [Bacteriophage sp.]DAM38032.1 MAG TPA: hypothetical protein [Caudoviricetes sp.]